MRNACGGINSSYRHRSQYRRVLLLLLIVVVVVVVEVLMVEAR